jgi:hypothetical protein
MENRKWKTGNAEPVNAEVGRSSAMAGLEVAISGFLFSIFVVTSKAES